MAMGLRSSGSLPLPLVLFSLARIRTWGEGVTIPNHLRERGLDMINCQVPKKPVVVLFVPAKTIKKSSCQIFPEM
jgi:hypothetical protein